MTAELRPLSSVLPPSLGSYDDAIAPPAIGPEPTPPGPERVDRLAVRQDAQRIEAFTEQEIRDAAAKMNSVAEAIQANIRYRVHERSNALQIQIVDIADNDRVIREVPSTEMLNVLARTHEALGLIFDENA